MNIKDKLTIVIPSFNEENYIERTITNLANQNNITGTRVIIADGFSRDRTRSKIINLKHSLKDKINIELVNGGKVAYARNFGLTLVKTKYVLFMDADTVLMDNNIIDDNNNDNDLDNSNQQNNKLFYFLVYSLTNYVHITVPTEHNKMVYL